MRRLTIVFEGHVQGVGFRWTAARVARDAGVVGWVRNEPDGSVRLVAEGAESLINGFVANLRAAMRGYIRGEQPIWSEATGEFDSFEIRR